MPGRFDVDGMAGSALLDCMQILQPVMPCHAVAMLYVLKHAAVRRETALLLAFVSDELLVLVASIS